MKLVLFASILKKKDLLENFKKSVNQVLTLYLDFGIICLERNLSKFFSSLCVNQRRIQKHIFFTLKVLINDVFVREVDKWN